MCMSLASSVKERGSFVATDTRVQWYDLKHYDTGGKLVDTGTGFAVGGGAHEALGAALGALRTAGGHADSVLHRLLHLSTELRTAGYSPAVVQPIPHDESFLSVLIIDAENPDIVTRTNGGLYDSFENDWAMSLPRMLPKAEEEERWKAMRADFKKVGADLGSRIRTAALHFDQVSKRTATMSGDMELGYILPTVDGPVRGYLRGNARDIAAADPRMILLQFRADCPNRLADEILGPFDDMQFSLRATENDGSTKSSSAMTRQGSIVPASTTGNLLSYASGGPGGGSMWIAWSWAGFTIRNPDGTTISVGASSSLATPPSPTLTQVSLGSLGARTVFARIGYMKNGLIYRVGASASLAVTANKVLKITSPVAVAGYDGWIALVGSASSTLFTQSVTIPFGTDFTEAATGFDTTTTPYNNASWPNGVVSTGLNISTTYFFYPFWDLSLGTVLFTDAGATAKSDTAAIQQNSDEHVGLSAGAAAGLTPTAGNSGSGSVGGAKYL